MLKPKEENSDMMWSTGGQTKKNKAFIKVWSRKKGKSHYEWHWIAVESIIKHHCFIHKVTYGQSEISYTVRGRMASLRSNGPIASKMWYQTSCIPFQIKQSSIGKDYYINIKIFIVNEINASIVVPIQKQEVNKYCSFWTEWPS